MSLTGTDKSTDDNKNSRGNSISVTNDYNVVSNRKMPKWEIDEDIVISGIAGRFPESDNMDEFADNLYKNINMVTIDDRRWPTTLNNGKGAATGKLKSIDKFDCAFFSTLTILADAMDPQSRILLETTYEAMFDAGLNPQLLRGSRTGVYVGIDTTACDEGYPQDDYNDVRKKEAALWVQGSSRALYANRISFLFDFIGPSTVVDSSDSSSMVCLVNALNDIRCDACDLAIVATANLCLAPYNNQIYSALDGLSVDGKCKVWDMHADGTVRSETIGCLVLQRKSDAKRNYASVMHAKTNTDGFKSDGLFSSYWKRQRDLLVETYQEAGVSPNEIRFMEAHGTGSREADSQEAKAIAEAFSINDRKVPLLVGAVKSNCGNAEGSSAFCSLAKVVLTFENAMIPANLHFKQPNSDMNCLIDGKVVPVTTNTPFDSGIVGVNCFSKCGVNATTLLKRNEKETTEESYLVANEIPRIIYFAGRTEAGVNYMFDFIEKNPRKLTRDFLALLGEVSKTVTVKGSTGFPYRGYMIAKQTKMNEKDKSIEYEFTRTIKESFRNATSVWLVFSGMGSQWTGMAKSLMVLKPFVKSITRAANVLKPYNIDLMNLLMKEDESEWKKTTYAFVAITSMQVALYDLIKLLNLEVGGIIGHSFGEIACAYADGCLTLEQAVLTSFWRGKIVETSTLPKGMLAAVGFSWEDAKKKCPKGIVPACHNGSNSVTISGLHDEMQKFVKQLKSENIFARQVAGGDYPYHSPFMNLVEPKLIEALKSVIREPKRRSEKWRSTSISPSKWDEESSKYASPEYFAHNLVSPVLFNEAMKVVPSGSVCIEVAPHSLFESIFKRCFKEYPYVGLMKRADPDNLTFFLNSIGKIYSLGLNPHIEEFYPKVKWPVARGTQSISSLMRWEHDSSFQVKKYPDFYNFGTASDYMMKFSSTDPDWLFLRDHTIDGRTLFPATGYIMMVWRRLAAMKGQPWSKTPFAMENVRFHRPTLLGDQEVRFVVRIIEGTGEFTIMENENIVATGNCWVPDEPLELQDTLLENEEENEKKEKKEGEDGDEDNKEEDEEEKLHEILTAKEVYKELRIRGYDYGLKFQGLVEARGDGQEGKVKWTGHVASYFDSMMHLALVALPIRALFVPVGFQSFRCDPNVMYEAIIKAKKEYAEQMEQEELDKLKQNNSKSDQQEEELLLVKQEKPKMGYMGLGNTSQKDANTSQDGEEKFIESGEIKQFRSGYENDKTGSEYVSMAQVGDDTIAKEIMGVTKLRGGDEIDIDIPALMPVKFDINLRSIVTNGVEVRGFIPVNIPRRPITKGLILEKFTFVPHNEENAIDDHVKQETVDYIQVCCSLVKQLLEVHGRDTKLELNGFRFADEETVENYVKSPQENQTMLKALNELLSLKLDENLNIIPISSGDDKKGPTDLESAIKMILSKTECNLYKDSINNLWNNERLIRPSLDLLIENSSDKAFKVLEIGSNSGILGNHVIQMIRSSVIGIYTVDYYVANPLPSAISEELKENPSIRVIEWDTSKNDFLHDVNQLDMIIYRPTNEIINEWDLTQQIDALSNSLRDNGFLVLTARTRSTPPEAVISQLFSASQIYTPQILSSNVVDKFVSAAIKKDFFLVSQKNDSLCSQVVTLRKYKQPTKQEKLVINIRHKKYQDWFETVKDIMARNKENKEEPVPVWLIANDGASNGVIALTKCLRLEPGGHLVRCIFDFNSKLPSKIDFTMSPFKEIENLNLAVNVFKNGQWGTYRHFTLPSEIETIPSEHAYLNVITRGDMSSLRWYDAQHKYWVNIPESERNPKEVLCNVYYSALNFKDVVLVSGKIQPGPESALFDCVIGLEFAGRRSDTGEKVMGMVPFKGIATTLLTYKEFLWDVPEHWSLEDAATVPVVYATAFYSLIMRGKLQQGDSVLIHSGAGGVGQAAIFICQYYNCEVFVTVGNKEKREFMKQKFGLDDKHIANSHDITFEKHIMKVTKGRGVDIVLNSLTEDKLQASIRCLANNGKFLEIGKYDMQMNKQIGLDAFLKNISFHGVGLDCIFRDGPNSKNLQRFMKEMNALLQDGIKKGFVQPIERTVFETSKAESAFRYMTTGKHIGKVLIKIRDEEKGMKHVTTPKKLVVPALTKTWFHPYKTYIITGGLGGFGLELAYWMVLKGAKKLLLTSRTGVKNAYQNLYLKRFKEFGKILEDYKIEIAVSINNAIEIEGAYALLDEAAKIGPVGGIFNLALVLSDAMIENQTIETFIEVCEPKADGLRNLDIATREKCPELEYFVAFSSIVGGRGNAGQTNYGYANSAMERICEDRREKGFPGLTVQFGPIGDVGIVAEQLLDSESSKDDVMKMFGGIILQRLNSCLDVLDRFMQTSYPTLSSHMKADLEANDKQGEDEVLLQLCNHLAIDKRNPNETLGDIGLDSMMAVEIQQRLERDYEISLSLNDVRRITVGELKDFRDGKREGLKQYAADIKNARLNLAKIKWDFPNETHTHINESTEGAPIFILPPIEGVFSNLMNMAKAIKRPLIALHWMRHMKEMSDVKKVSKYYIDKLKQLCPEGNYDLIGHSFGAIVSLNMLRKNAPIKRLIILDTSLKGVNEMPEKDEKYEIFFSYLGSFFPMRVLQQVRNDVMPIKEEQKRIIKLIELIRQYGGKHMHGKDPDEILRQTFARADMIIHYKRKNMLKIQALQEHAPKMIKTRLNKIRSNVTVLKLVRDEEEYKSIKEIIMVEYGAKSEDFDKPFDFQPVYGKEGEFMSEENGNFDIVVHAVNKTLCS